MAKVNENLLILVVGNIDQWISSGRDLPNIAHTQFCAYSNLSADLLAYLQPDIILCPLLCEHFDILDLVGILDELNYSGRIRAMSPPMPNPDIILREISFEYPAMDFDLIEVQPGPKLRPV